MFLTTPDITNSSLLAFCKNIVPGQNPIYVKRKPLPFKPTYECFAIVPEHVATHGGQQRFGWAIWDFGGIWYEAEFHCVWESPSQGLIDLSPRTARYIGKETLFLLDAETEYKGIQIKPIIYPLVKSSRIEQFIRLGDRLFELLNEGDLADQYGNIRMPEEYLIVRDSMQKLHREIVSIFYRQTRER